MKMILETLTPVFIRSGETIEPYEYFIKDRFYRINLPKFILSFDDMKIYNVKTFSKKDKFSASGYNMMFEGTRSYYFDRAAVASHDIWIDEDLKKKSRFIDINIKKIISSCNEFYGSSKTSYAYEKYEQLSKDMGSLKNENSFILRLGWGSGYNSVTINLAKERPDNKISRRLIKGEFPSGWVKVKIMEEK